MFRIINSFVDANGKHHKTPNSIVESCWMCKTKSGYEVGINLSVRWPLITGTGSSGSLDDQRTRSISIKTDRMEWDQYRFDIEWDVPADIDDLIMAKNIQIEKDQIIIDFYDRSLTNQVGPIIEEYHNPLIVVKRSLEKIGIK